MNLKKLFEKEFRYYFEPAGLKGEQHSSVPDTCSRNSFFFLIGIVGGGVQLGPLGIAATNRPIIPAPGVYDDGEIGGMIGR
jgi:hypothetical protein